MVTKYDVIGSKAFLNKNACFSPFWVKKMFNCIIFYNCSKIYLQFMRFSDKFKLLVKSKMAAILAAILDDVTGPPAVPWPIIFTLS